MNRYESAQAIKSLDRSLEIVKDSIHETDKIDSEGLPSVSRLKLFFLGRLQNRTVELEGLVEHLFPHVTVLQAGWLGDKLDMLHDFQETIRTLKETEQHQLNELEDSQ